MSDNKPVSVNVGVAIMQAWQRHQGVSANTTLIVPREFSEGFKAGMDYGSSREKP